MQESPTSDFSIQDIEIDRKPLLVIRPISSTPSNEMKKGRFLIKEIEENITYNYDKKLPTSKGFRKLKSIKHTVSTPIKRRSSFENNCIRSYVLNSRDNDHYEIGEIWGNFMEKYLKNTPFLIYQYSHLFLAENRENESSNFGPNKLKEPIIEYVPNISPLINKSSKKLKHFNKNISTQFRSHFNSPACTPKASRSRFMSECQNEFIYKNSHTNKFVLNDIREKKSNMESTSESSKFDSLQICFGSLQINAFKTIEYLIDNQIRFSLNSSKIICEECLKKVSVNLSII
jgi:hypothetical protein